LLLAGCGKSVFSSMSDKEQKTPLFSVDKYYKFMQWKYYEKAANFVYPEDIPTFDKAVAGIQDDLNITSYEVKELIVLDEEDKETPTAIRVVLTYYKYPSVAEKKVEITDTWVNFQEKIWLIKSDFDSEIFEPRDAKN
ncbi:MAG: hypothetical protein ACR2NW_02565, partial [Thermodesulfobacteriota bacterium]